MIFIWLGPKKAAFFLPKIPEGEGDSSYLKSGRFFGFVFCFFQDSTPKCKTCRCTLPSGTSVHHITHVPLCRLAGRGEDSVLLCGEVFSCFCCIFSHWFDIQDRSIMYERQAISFTIRPQCNIFHFQGLQSTIRPSV